VSCGDVQWSAPYQCSMALYFLSRQLGVAILAGLVVMLLSIPISAAVARRTRTIQRSLMKVRGCWACQSAVVLAGTYLGAASCTCCPLCMSR
jgi:hypothetical protein